MSAPCAPGLIGSTRQLIASEPACASLMAAGLDSIAATAFVSALAARMSADVAPTASGRILGFTNTVGVLVGIVANVATGRVLDATGSFKAVFALTAAIYLSEVIAFFGFVRAGPLVEAD